MSLPLSRSRSPPLSASLCRCARSLSFALCLSLLLQLPCVHQLLFHFYVASLVSFNFYFYFCMASVCSSWLSVCSSTSISLLYWLLHFTSLDYTSRTAIFFFVVVRPSCNLQRSDSGAVAYATAASRWCHEAHLGLSDCRYHGVCIWSMWQEYSRGICGLCLRHKALADGLSGDRALLQGDVLSRLSVHKQCVVPLCFVLQMRLELKVRYLSANAGLHAARPEGA